MGFEMTHGDPYLYELTRDERTGLKKQLAAHLAERREIIFAYVFGSFVDDACFKDVDVAVYLDTVRVPAARFEEYRDKCSEELTEKLRLIFDVSVINDVPDPFKHSVFITGELLFSHDEALRTDMLEISSLAAMANEAASMQSFREMVI